MGTPSGAAETGMNRRFQLSNTEANTRTRWIGLTFLILVLCGLSPLWAQEISVTAEIDPNPLGLDDQLSLTVKISSPAGSAENPQLPKIDGLRLVAGPSISRNFQWINGQSSSSQTYSYIFEPEKEGTFRIPPLSVRVGGKIYQTTELYVQVVKNAGGGQKAAPKRRSPFSIFDDMGLEEDSPLRDRTPRRDEILTLAETDKKSVYVGEQLVLTTVVLTQVPVVQVQLKETPPLTGFWTEEVELPKTPEARSRVINGKRYAEYSVKKQVLFPTRAGNLQIPGSILELLVRNASSGFFSFPSQQVITRKTSPLEIKVNPLPESGKPQDFSGAVGDFRLEATVDKPQAGTGDAINLRVKLSGSGNFRTITDFPLPDLPGFRIYSSKSQDEVTVKNNLLQGGKSWDYVIVPQSPGREFIPELKFRYFSPEQRRYLETGTPRIAVAVVPGKEGPSGSAFQPGFAQQGLVKRGSDISYLKLPKGPLKDRSRHFYQSYWLYGLCLLPLVFNGSLMAYREKQVRLYQDQAGFRSRRARKVAERRLSQARKCLSHNELNQFHTILLESLTGYLSDRFGIPQIDITSQQISRVMVERHLNEHLAAEVASVLEECNYAKYAPVQLENARLNSLFQKARDVIERIERTVSA